MRDYAPHALSPIAPGARLPVAHPARGVTLDDPAVAVMTDLREVPVATTWPGQALDQAHELMIRRGVRLLFVLDEAQALAGVLTAHDLLGEKPMRFAQERALPREEVRVADLMTPTEGLQALSLHEVEAMRVGHVLATFRAVGRQHLLVAGEGGRLVCGLFSATQVARQLGIEIDLPDFARTFADIEAALAR